MLTKTVVTRDEFFSLVEKTRELAKQLKNVDTLVVSDILTEMKFCAWSNIKFRNKTYPELEELYEDLRKRVKAK